MRIENLQGLTTEENLSNPSAVCAGVLRMPVYAGCARMNIL